MRVLVTGIAGYIGSNLADRLLAGGFEVAGVDAFLDYYSVAIKEATAARLAERGVLVSRLDLAAGPLESLLEGVDAVVHLAAQPGISATTPWNDYERNNLVATHRLVEASRVAEVKRFVNVSSSSVYGLEATETEEGEPKPASWYGETKLAAERSVMDAWSAHGLPACSLRLFSVYGERERPEKLFPRLIRAIANAEAFPLFEGSWEHRRSFTYVGDICEAIVAALDNWGKAEGEIFNVGTERSFTTGQAIESVQAIMGRTARIKTLPKRPGDQAATQANIGKIRRTLGWAPRTELREGLERMVDWYKAEVHGKLEWR